MYQGKRQNTTTEMVQIYRSGGSCSMLVRTFAFQTIITAPNEDNSMMKTPRHACGMAVIEHDTWHEIEHKHNENKPLQQRLKHKSSNKKSSHTQFTNKYGRHVMVTVHRPRRKRTQVCDIGAILLPLFLPCLALSEYMYLHII
eukprot:444743_1